MAAEAGRKEQWATQKAIKKEEEKEIKGGEVEMYKIINRYLASGISSLIHMIFFDEHG